MALTVLDRGQTVDLGSDLGVGMGRIIAAPMTTPPATDLSDMIYVDTASDTDEVQTLTISGTPAGGNFKLRFRGYNTGVIAYNASAADVDTALEALASIGTGGVTCAGGPLPGTPVTITFAGQLADQNVPTIAVVDSALTGGTTPAAAVAVTTPGVGIYEVRNGWFDIGPTLGGITITHNNTEQTYTIDQLNGDIYAVPNGVEMGIAAAVSKINLETMKLFWEGGTIATIGGSGNRTMGLGSFSSYTQRRAAIISQRPSLDGGVTPGLIQAYTFRITQRSPAESSVVWQKEGAQRAPAFAWKVLPDTAVADERARYGLVIDESDH